jgi:ankyrin repeat protein
MSAQQMKQAIRDGHEVVRHEEFCGNVMGTRDLELLELYLDSDPSALDQLNLGSIVAWPRSASLVRKLLARGLNPNRTDWLGKTFLHACAELGDRSIAAILLDAGADINARDVEFQGTPLAAAVRACCAVEDPKQAERARRMVEFLLKRGARANLPGDELWATPMAWATRHGRGDLVELLNAAT